MKTIVHSDGAPPALGPYSQAVLVDGRRTLYCSGQVGLDPATKQMVEGGVEAQAARALENLRAVLAEADMSFDDVVRCTIFLTDMGDFAAVNAVYAKVFSGDPPARATVAVAGLPAGALVEIDAIAVS